MKLKVNYSIVESNTQIHVPGTIVNVPFSENFVKVKSFIFRTEQKFFRCIDGVIIENVTVM